ncbi:MAG: YceI family protein [Bacteroidota bacterium]
MMNCLGKILVITFLNTIAFNSFSQEWKIKEDYTVKFSGTGSEGTFRGLRGQITFDPSSLDDASINVSVDASTIDTGNKTKNKHARGDSWLDVENYPTISFQSSGIKPSDDGSYMLTGMFDFHGFQKEETFSFTFTETAEGGVLEGRLVINREEYGIEGPLFGFFVDDEFQVDLQIPLKR